MSKSININLPPDERLAEIYSEFYEKECPIEAFPSLIRRVAESIHLSHNLPMELLCFIACGIISGAMGSRFKACDAVGSYTQKPNMFFLGLGASSSGKSASLKILANRLLMLEMQERLKYAESLKLKEHEAIGAVVELVKEPKQMSFEDSKKQEVQVEPEAPKAEEKEEPKDPTFIVMNATSEAIARRMSENGGTVFSLCPEARSAIAIAGGGYKKEGDDTEIYNSGWSGEPIRQDRISRGVAEIHNPCLSLLWLVQYDAFFNIMLKNDSFRESGFSARFIFFKGPKEIPFDEGKNPKLNKVLLREWENFIESVFRFRQENETMEIYATDEAKEIFRVFHNEQVKLMNTDLRSIQEILGKARENAARLALIFAVAEGAEMITESIARNACSVVKYSLYNAVEFYTSGLVQVIEAKRAKMETQLRKKNGKLSISYLWQFAKLTKEEVLHIVYAFPDLYTIERINNGLYILLNEVY